MKLSKYFVTKLFFIAAAIYAGDVKASKPIDTGSFGNTTSLSTNNQVSVANNSLDTPWDFCVGDACLTNEADVKSASGIMQVAANDSPNFIC